MLNDEFHAAKEVWKSDSARLNTFIDRGTGELGTIDDRQIIEMGAIEELSPGSSSTREAAGSWFNFAAAQQGAAFLQGGLAQSFFASATILCYYYSRAKKSAE